MVSKKYLWLFALVWLFGWTMGIEAVELSVSQESGEPGAAVTLTLSLDETEGVTGGDITLTYDATQLLATEVRPTDLLQGLTLVDNISRPGQVLIAMAGATGLPAGQGVIVEVDFNILPQATSDGIVPVQITGSDLWLELGDILPVTVRDGGITVVGGAPSQDLPPWDVNQDGQVDILDIVLVGQHFGEVYTSAVPATLDWSLLPATPTTLALQLVPQATHSDLVAVQVKVQNSQSLYGYQFGLAYDPVAVRVLGVQQGDFLRQQHHETYWSAGAEQSGMIRGIFACQRGRMEGATGDGVLVTVYLLSQTEQPIQLRILEPVLVNDQGDWLGVLPVETTLRAEQYLVPSKGRLLPNYPNPFNPETWIPFELAEPADMGLFIYSASGRLVRSMLVGHRSAGIYRSQTRAVYWDGRDDSGQSVASGVYFYTLHGGKFSQTRRMVILR